MGATFGSGTGYGGAPVAAGRVLAGSIPAGAQGSIALGNQQLPQVAQSNSVGYAANGVAAGSQLTQQSSYTDYANRLSQIATQQAQMAESKGQFLAAEGFRSMSKQWAGYAGMNIQGNGFGQAPQIINTPQEVAWLNNPTFNGPPDPGFFTRGIGNVQAAISGDSSVAGYDVGNGYLKEGSVFSPYNGGIDQGPQTQSPGPAADTQQAIATGIGPTWSWGDTATSGGSSFVPPAPYTPELGTGASALAGMDKALADFNSGGGGGLADNWNSRINGPTAQERQGLGYNFQVDGGAGGTYDQYGQPIGRSALLGR